MRPQTDYFHLFLCVAIIFLYGEDVTDQQLATDQMLLHFSNLSMHMNGELVLRKVNAFTPRTPSAARGRRNVEERRVCVMQPSSASQATPEHSRRPRAAMLLRTEDL